MPIYEYRCFDCHRQFSIFCKMNDREETPSCEKCNSRKTKRLISRFKTVRSEDQIMETMADPSMLSGIDENDPRSIARWAKKMAKEMGEDMGDEIEAMAEEELSKGENAFKDPPSMGEDMGSPGMEGRNIPATPSGPMDE